MVYKIDSTHRPWFKEEERLVAMGKDRLVEYVRVNYERGM